MNPRRPLVHGVDLPHVLRGQGLVVFEGLNQIEEGILKEYGPLWQREFALALYHAGRAGLTAEEVLAFIKSVFGEAGVE